MKYNLTESKFQMWRGTIALAHADGVVSQEEIEWLKSRLDNIPFNQEQLTLIQKDIDEGITLNQVLPLITDIKDRAHLLHFANNLFREDGLDDIEKVQYEQLQQKVMSDVDLMAAVKQVEMEMANIKLHQEEQAKNTKGIFKSLVSYFENS